MTDYAFDPDRSEIAVYTFAEGLLARLAHDLKLVVVSPALHGTVSPTPLDSPSAELTIPIDSLRVAGVMKRGRLDTTVLSFSDANEIQNKLRNDVLRGANTLRVRGKVDDSRAAIFVSAGGPELSVRAPVSYTVLPDGGLVMGRVSLSLKGLGLGTVRGPLNAFTLKDSIEVEFKLAFRRKDA